jgi:hypothetical protein
VLTLASRGVPESSESAVLASLHWLARHQNEDGSWSVDRFYRHCSGVRCSGAGGDRCDDCATALAVLSFVRAGYGWDSTVQLADPGNTGRDILLRDVVAKGKSWLSARGNYRRCIGAQAMFDRISSETPGVPKSGGPDAKKLLSAQKTSTSGCAGGSWEVEAVGAGRVSLVALNALRLEGVTDPAGMLGRCEGGYR